MFRKITLLAFILSYCTLLLNAQKAWSLEECVRYAQQNSLLVKQVQYGIRNAELSEKQGKLSRLPSANATISGGFQFGRTIDPTTNLFRSEEIGFNNYSVSLGMMVYNGNRINNSIKQSKIDLEAAQLDAQSTANDIGLRVAFAYLNILLAEEQLQNGLHQKQQSEEQLRQTDKLVQAGSLPANERLNFLAQIALNEQRIIEAQNQVTINYLSLKNLMELGPEEDIRVIKPVIGIPADANPEALTFGQVYSTALTTQPQATASELRIESAQLGENIAKSNLLPSLSIGGSLSTNTSTASQDISKPNFDNVTEVLGDPEPVVINGIDASLQQYGLEGDVTFPKASFGKQFTDNFGQSVGATIRIPIYNNHSNRIAMERARLDALNSEVNHQQVLQQLKTDVQRAIADAKAANESYKAAMTSVEANQAAFDNAEKRFNLGAINTLDYTTAKNNLDLAQTELTRSKYAYIFYLKIVDFYLGKELRLE